MLIAPCSSQPEVHPGLWASLPPRARRVPALGALTDFSILAAALRSASLPGDRQAVRTALASLKDVPVVVGVFWLLLIHRSARGKSNTHGAGSAARALSALYLIGGYLPVLPMV